MTYSTYEETLTEIANDLEVEDSELREWFTNWLATRPSHEYDGPKEQLVACYALYRITKLKSACRLVRKSREAWRERAISLGSPLHLRDDAD